MLNSKVRRRLSSYNLLSHLAVACGVGLLLGAAALWFSPLWVLGGVLGILFFVGIASKPELGLLALVFLTSSFIRPDAVDLRLPVGGLDLRDLTLMGMFGILILHGLIRKKLTVPWWPVSGPLLVFLGFAIFSALYALLYQGGESNWTFGELRTLIYYAVFFLTAWAITRPKQLFILLAGLFFLADLTATVVILQQFLGSENPLLAVMSGTNWHVWQMGDPSIGFGAVRIVPPGHVLVFVMTIIAFCLIVFARQTLRMRAVLALQFVYLNIGLLFTYTRAQWVASAIALGLISILLSSADRIQLVRYLLIVILVLLPVYGLLRAELQETPNSAPFVDILVSRALSILTPHKTAETYSVEWRIFETDEALRSVSQHPLLGVGLGNVYRDPTLLHGEAISGYLRFTRYVHNSYLYIAVKMGLLGLVAFLWFCLAFLASGWRAYMNALDEQFKRIMLAILASFVGLLAWSIFQPHLLQVESTIVVGLMVGMIASMRHIEKE